MASLNSVPIWGCKSDGSEVTTPERIEAKGVTREPRRRPLRIQTMGDERTNHCLGTPPGNAPASKIGLVAW